MNTETTQNRDDRNEVRQQLSAFIDGELERDQARFLVKRLESDAELGGCWQRWHAAGDVLRGQATAPLRHDFASRIALALQAEAIPARRNGAQVLKWAGGFAVAASVTLVALLAIEPVAVPDGAPAATPMLAQQAAPAPAQVAASPYREQDLRPPLRLDAQMVAATDASPYASAVRIDPRIESYLVRHNEATAAQGRGFVPYVTLVTPLRAPSAAPAAAPAAEPPR